MAVYNYPGPRAPKYKKPTSMEDCIPQAKRLVKISSGDVYGTSRLSQNRYVLGPVKKGDQILIIPKFFTQSEDDLKNSGLTI